MGALKLLFDEFLPDVPCFGNYDPETPILGPTDPVGQGTDAKLSKPIPA